MILQGDNIKETGLYFPEFTLKFISGRTAFIYFQRSFLYFSQDCKIAQT